MNFLYKCLLVLIIVFTFPFRCNDQDNPLDWNLSSWELLGMDSILVSQLRIFDRHLYACAGKDGLYRLDRYATDAQWEHLGFADSSIERDLESGVTDIIMVDGDMIVSYVAEFQLQKSGVYRSSDDGKTWFALDSGMITNQEFPTTSLVIRLKQFPENPRRILAGTTYDVVYLSEDGGFSWRKLLGIPGASAINYSIQFTNTDPTKIWIGGETGRFAPYLRYSSDGGNSWSDHILFPPNIGPYTYDNAVYDIAIDPTNHRILYFGMLGVIVKTTDDALTFQRVLDWEDGVFRHWRVEINPNYHQEILATGLNLYRSTDSGKSWERIKSPYKIYALAVDWEDRVLYVSSASPENGIYKLRF